MVKSKHLKQGDGLLETERPQIVNNDLQDGRWGRYILLERPQKKS